MAEALRYQRGGTVGLYRLLAEYGEAIEADLARYHRIRLPRALYGPPEERLTVRELLVRIRHLPQDSAFGIAMRGAAALWDANTYLLARMEHRLAGANWQRGGGKGPKPKPIEVPDGRQEQRRRDYVNRLRNLGMIPEAA